MTTTIATRRRAAKVIAVVVGILLLLLLAVAAGGRRRLSTTTTTTTPSSSPSSSVSPRRRPARRALPEKVLMGYATGIDYGKVRDAVILDGVNVVIWAFVDVVPKAEDRRRNSTTVGGSLRTDLDLGRIGSLILDLDADGFSHVVHLASLGGWNGPHLHRGLMSAVDWVASWSASDASGIFHGIDWDFEGNDDRSSPSNYFDLNCLNGMGEISRLMKVDGYAVTMAPPQSYLNFADPNFGRYVNATRDRGWHDDFGYFGNNVYAYLLDRYGPYIDLVSIQLYESYSDAAMSIHRDGTSPDDYLHSLVRNVAVAENMSFPVDFGRDPALAGSMGSSRRVRMDLDKLVIGLANGWAFDSPDNRTLFVSAEDCRSAYLRLKDNPEEGYGDITPRGFMFWTIDERGRNGVYLARGIGEFLHTTRESGGGGEGGNVQPIPSRPSSRVFR
jgi:beta-glucosidase